MPFEVVCPECQGSFRLADNYSMRTVECEHCQTLFPTPPKPAGGSGGAKQTASSAPKSASPSLDDDDLFPISEASSKFESEGVVFEFLDEEGAKGSKPKPPPAGGRKLDCPECGTGHQVPADFSKRTMECSNCQTIFPVPSAPAPSAATAPPSKPAAAVKTAPSLTMADTNMAELAQRSAKSPASPPTSPSVPAPAEAAGAKSPDSPPAARKPTGQREVKCTECGAPHRIAPGFNKQTLECAACGTIFPVPAAPVTAPVTEREPSGEASPTPNAAKSAVPAPPSSKKPASPAASPDAKKTPPTRVPTPPSSAIPLPTADPGYEVLDDEEDVPAPAPAASSKPKRSADTSESLVDAEDPEHPQYRRRVRDDDDAPRTSSRSDADQLIDIDDAGDRLIDIDEEPEAAPPPKTRKRAAAPVRDDGDEEDESDASERRSTRKAKGRRTLARDDDDEEVGDADAEWDEDSERPTRKKSGMVKILALLAALIVVGGGAAAGWYLLNDTDSTDIASNDTPTDSKPTDPVDTAKTTDPKVDPKPIDPKVDPKLKDPKVDPKIAVAAGPQFVDLPGEVQRVVLCDRGRIILYRINQPSVLVVFDASAGQVMRQIPLPGERVLVAGGRSAFVTYDPADKTLRRWSLDKLEPQQSQVLSGMADPRDISRGHDSDGAIMASFNAPKLADRFRFFDGEKLAPMLIEIGGLGDDVTGTRLRSDAYGRFWMEQGTIAGRPALSVIRLSGNSAEVQSTLFDAPFVTFGDEGYPVFHGAKTATLPPVLIGGRATVDSPYALPSIGWNRIMEISADAPAPPNAPGGSSPVCTVTMTDDSELPTSIRLDDVPSPIRSGSRSDVTAEQRLLVVPERRRIVSLCQDDRRLVHRTFDITAEFAKTKKDWLMLSTTPSVEWKISDRNEHKMAPVGSSAQLTFASDPASLQRGLVIYADGKTDWQISHAAPQPFSFRLSAKDEKGRTATRTYYKLPPIPPKEIVVKKDPMGPKKVNVSGPPLVAIPKGPADVKPADWAGDRIDVALPGVARDLVTAGGGRYVVLWIPNGRKAVIVDLSTGKVHKVLQARSDNVLLAGGQDYLCLVYPDENLVERWNIARGEKDSERRFDAKRRIVWASMGHSSNGPLVLGGPSGQPLMERLSMTFIDLEPLKEIEIAEVKGEPLVTFTAAAEAVVSADGRTVGMRFRELRPSGIQTLRLVENTIMVEAMKESEGYVIPSADGTYLATARRVRFREETGPTPKDDDPIRAVIPATSGHEALAIEKAAGSTDADPIFDVGILVRPGDREPALRFKDLPAFGPRSGPFDRDVTDFPQHRRIVYSPDAKVIAVVVNAGDKLHLRKADSARADPAKLSSVYRIQGVPPRSMPRNTPINYVPTAVQFGPTPTAVRNCVWFASINGKPAPITNGGDLKLDARAGTERELDVVIRMAVGVGGVSDVQSFRVKVVD